MRQILLIAFSIVASGLLAETVTAAAPTITDIPRWSLDSLDGIRSYHDGANCFNGVAVALGYVDHLTHTDAMELRYFLELFCQRNYGRPRPRDVLTVLIEGTLGHGALFLKAGRIFEKSSILGFMGQSRDTADSLYQSTSITESEYFNECHAPDCIVEIYTCRKHSSVRPQLRRCIEAADRSGITALRKVFQEITLSPSQKFSLGHAEYLLMNQIVRSIDNLTGEEECALYLLASGSSILGQLFNLNAESSLGSNWAAAMDALGTALKKARRHIREFDTSDTTARILRESSWIPH